MYACMQTYIFVIYLIQLNSIKKMSLIPGGQRGRKTVVLDKSKMQSIGGGVRDDVSMISRRTNKSVYNPDGLQLKAQKSMPGNLDGAKLQDQRNSMAMSQKPAFSAKNTVYSTSKKQSILTEPSSQEMAIKRIPNLEKEKQNFKEKEIEAKPVEIYLDHCNQYAKTNLVKNELLINNYQFRKNDFESGLVSQDVLDRMKNQNDMAISKNFNPNMLQDHAFANLFKTETIKLFTDFIFVDKKQYILVKTWQKVHWEKPSHDNLPTKGIESINSRMDFKAKGGASGMTRQNNDGEDNSDDQSFYIKTLQIFDKEGQALDDPILVEQVYGEFDSYRLYDISTLHYKDSLYFFKRIYVNLSAESNFDDASPLVDDQLRMNPQIGASSLNQSMESISNNMKRNKSKKKRKEKTHLQLYCYDLRSGTERVVERVKIEEGDLQQLDEQVANRVDMLKNSEGQQPGPPPAKGANLLAGLKKVKINKDENQEQDTQKFGGREGMVQYNVIFSQKFGPQSKSETEYDKYETEETKFLHSQYFCIQQYVMGREQYFRFRIYQIADYSIQGRFEKSLIFQSTFDKDSNDLNRQVQFMNNIVTTNELDLNNDETNHFLITNMFILIQINIQKKRDANKNSSSNQPEPVMFPRKYTDIFQKIWNSGGIIPQVAKISNNDDEIREDKIDQYFFVDSRNEIQLLFPNTKQKVEILRRTEQINDIFHIKKSDRMQRDQEYKKIICIDYLAQDKGQDREFVNVVQNIKHLQKILNLDNMHQAQSLVFVKDIEGQTLYINEPASNIITFFRMSEQNSERCEEIQQSEQQTALQLQQESQNMSIQDKGQQAQAIKSQLQKRLTRKFKGQMQEDAKDMGQNTEQDKKSAMPQLENCNIDNQMSSQGANSMQLQEMTENRIRLTYITDLNHQEPYISYKREKGNQNMKMKRLKEDDEGNDEEFLEPNERQNHIWIDDFEGNKVKVRTFNSETTEYSTISQNLKLILYQMTSDNKYGMFLFGVYNVKMQGAGAQSDLRVLKKSYIFVRKTREELNEIFQSEQNMVLIQKNEKVILIKSYFDMSYHGFNDIQNFQFDVEENDQNDERESEEKETMTPFRDVEILLSSGVGIETQRMNFIPFIYQESHSKTSNMFIVFDINQNKPTDIINISPSQANIEHIYEDENGCNMFMLARTSEIEETKKQDATLNYSAVPFTQRVKYQVFYLYRERIGRIQGEEFLIHHTSESTKIQTIGHKHLMFSKDCMESYSWDKIRESRAVPYFDDGGIAKGCTIQLKTHQDIRTNQDMYRLINLKDQDITNIYELKTDVIFAGQKKFYFQLPTKQVIKNDDQTKISADKDLYIIAICVQFNRNYTELNIFDRCEAQTCLHIAEDLILRQRIPDLEYIVLNSFEDLKRKDFFRSQLILQGKSLCDICITDQRAVLDGCTIEVDGKEFIELKGSIIEQIIQGDHQRRLAMQETKFYPMQLLCQIDLNFQGTIGRAFSQVSFQAVKILLEKVIEQIGTIDYHQYVMFDMYHIIESKQVRINDFFGVDKAERKEGADQACNLEIFLKSPELPQFSDEAFEYYYLSNEQLQQSIANKRITNYRDMHNDLTQWIIERDSERPYVSQNYEAEYFFIDYQMMIIDEKIRSIRNNVKIPKFDDLYFAQLILKKTKDEINNTFFRQESVQKIINAQWERTKLVQRRIFFMYFFFYCIPMCVSCFKISDKVDNLMFNIAFCPSIVLFIIEGIQLHKDGRNYFQGWNNLDFSQLLLFYFLFYLRQKGYDNDLSFFPMLKLMNILLAFAKMGFFVRIFEDYGFLVQMVISVIASLIPFTVVFGVFIIIFAICNFVLKMDISEEEDEAQKFSFFQKTVLQIFRTGIGELGMPVFKTILEDEDTIFRSMNIYLLWVLWFLTTFTLLIFMLNFMIAVITNAYQRVMNYQKIISYKHKSDLNYETYMLLSKFIQLKEYRFLVLMSSSSVYGGAEDEFDDKGEQFKKFIHRECIQLSSSAEQLDNSIVKIKTEQIELENDIQNQFINIRQKRDQMERELFEVLNQAQFNNRQ